MKLFITLSLCIIITLTIFYRGNCQTTDTYLVTLEGDTLFTEIKFSPKLHVNNREVIAKENGKFTRYYPSQLKGFYNGKYIFESRNINGVSAFLLRRVTGSLNLYLCDETVVNEMKKMENPVGQAAAVGVATGGIVGGLVAGAVAGAVTEAVHMPEIPIVGLSEGGLKIFNPNNSKKQRTLELQTYFREVPEIDSIISREPFTLDVYIDAVEANNRFQVKEAQRNREEDKKTNGF